MFKSRPEYHQVPVMGCAPVVEKRWSRGVQQKTSLSTFKKFKTVSKARSHQGQGKDHLKPSGDKVGQHRYSDLDRSSVPNLFLLTYPLTVEYKFHATMRRYWTRQWDTLLTLHANSIDIRTTDEMTKTIS